MDITTLDVNLSKLSELDLRGVCIAKEGEVYDIESRFFAPKYGINEDSVTGSAYTQLIPYFAKKLSKRLLRLDSVHLVVVDLHVH